MRTKPKVSIAALALAAGLSGCGNDSTDASQQELQRDLQLASATTMTLASPRIDSALLNSMETKPAAAPQPSRTVKKGAGSRAVRSETPTVLATPDVDVAALDAAEEAQTESVAPAPESSEPVAVAPRPAPVLIPASGDYGAGNGGGIFGGGTGTGVVIRGGGVDGDNCELHRRPGRGGMSTGPVYIPSPTMPRTGGIFVGGGSPMRPRAMDRPSAPRSTGRQPAGFSGMRSRRGT